MILYSYEEIIAQLDGLDSEELAELIKIIDETLRHHTLDLILTHLPNQHHEEFLIKFNSDPHDQTLLDYLKIHIPDIEPKLKDHTSKIKAEILRDIRKSRKI